MAPWCDSFKLSNMILSKEFAINLKSWFRKCNACRLEKLGPTFSFLTCIFFGSSLVSLRFRGVFVWDCVRAFRFKVLLTKSCGGFLTVILSSLRNWGFFSLSITFIIAILRTGLVWAAWQVYKSWVFLHFL